ncbi:MAG: DUF3048 domain-containing protein, partial [Halanaerobiaceae bacterium]
MKKKFALLLLLIVFLIGILTFVFMYNQNSTEIPTDNSLDQSSEQFDEDIITEIDPDQIEIDKEAAEEDTATEQENEDDDSEQSSAAEKKEFYSPFSGEIIDKHHLQKPLMVIIENSPISRPQAGLAEASIIYEVLVEGGITRLMALYWDEIPEKIGPVRSARPYMINITEEYRGLLLHAGASPAGFSLLAENVVDHLDQITKGEYYWRTSDSKAPHNLYTGKKMLEDYLVKLPERKYEPRFSFQYISVVEPGMNKADIIKIPFLGKNKVIYKYDKNKNRYYRYHNSINNPHNVSNDKQLAAENILIQYVKTEVIDNVGRLEIELENRGKAMLIRDGIVVEGYW